MPTYVYGCNKKGCGARVEELKPIAQRFEAPAFCPTCGSNASMELTMQATPNTWHCPGQHKMDYSKTGRRKG